jgi:hypothetical protein
MQQAECIKLLFDRLTSLRSKYAASENWARFRRPVYHILVLFVDKEESVKRQVCSIGGRTKEDVRMIPYSAHSVPC